jgi:putative ABC transport system permease protein
MSSFGRDVAFAVRTLRKRAALREVDPQFVVTELVPLSENVSRAMAPTRFALGLISVFAALAATLAGIGLYGVLANLVRQRASEIGVRMAFGAQPSSIFRLIIGQGMVLCVAGVAAGLIGAFWLTRAMARMLVSVTPIDPVTFASMAALFFGIAAAACWIPARRAASLQPSVALRDD